MELLDRLWKHSIIDESTNCWLWIGSCNEKGYGQIGLQGFVQKVHRVSAHIHLGLHLDNEAIHVLHKLECLNKNCWNPKHLYLGTNDENQNDRAKLGHNISPKIFLTECKHGHPLSGDNLYLAKDGRRRCNICRRENTKRHYLTKRQTLAAYVKTTK